MSDRSLDEFVTGASDDEAERTDDEAERTDDEAERTDDVQGQDEEAVGQVGEEGGDSDSAEPTDAATDSNATADPASPTMRWTPDGTACQACGAVVSRRWIDEAGFVCADCKEW